MEDVGKFTLKLERYRYNLIVSISWVIFGGIFATAIMVQSALLLLGFGSCSVFIFVPTVIISSVIFYKIKKVISPVDRGVRKWELVLFVFPFLIFYALIPHFLNMNDLQASAYFSTIWYPSLGVAFILVGTFIERRDKMLVTRTKLPAGILTLLTSVPLELLCMEVRSYYDAVAASLIASALMLSIYTACTLYCFFRGYRAFF